MAKLALTVGGAIIGFAIGGPFGAQIGAMIGGMVGNALFSPSVKGPRLTDLTVTASTYGQTIAELYGTMRLGGNLIWTTGLIEKKKKSGGKGGPKQVTYSYSASFAIAFCKGPVDGIIRIWADGKLIAGEKEDSDSNGQVLSTSGILNLTKKKKGKFKYRFYKGDEAQEPDSVIIAKEGEGNVPAYRGLAYLVFDNMPLEDFGNRIPQITVEITRNPVAAAPYAALSSDSTYGDPTWSYPSPPGKIDWDNQKLRKYNTSTREIITYDMRTMAELYRVSIQPAIITAEQVSQWSWLYAGDPGPIYPDGMGYITPTGAYMFSHLPRGNNSSPWGVWNAETGQYIGSFGQPSNSLSVNPMPYDTDPFDPDWATTGNGPYVAFTFRSGSQDYLFKTAGVGSDFVIWRPDLVPAYYSATGAGNDYTVVRGDSEKGDLLLIRSAWDGTKWRSYVRRITVPEGSVMQFNKIGPPFYATNPASIMDVEFELVPPAKETGDLRIATTTDGIFKAAYDKSDNSLVVWGASSASSNGSNGAWRFGKYLLDEGEWKWYTLDTELDPSLGIDGISPGGSVGYPNRDISQSNLDGGTVGWLRGAYAGALSTPSRIYTADLQTGQITQGPATTVTSYGNDKFIMSAWDDDTSSIMGEPTRLFLRTTSEGVTLQSIVDDVFTKTGALVPGQDWDSSELADISVHGYTISRDASAKDVLYQLASAYFFDGVESDYIVKCKLRGDDPVATIHEKHLSWVKDRDISVQETRTQEVELPMRVTVTYADTERDYQDGTQSAKRNTNPFPTMHSHTEQKFELPIAMTATDCKQIADKSLKMAWAGRWSYKMKMPWEFLKYDPTDVITVETNSGNSYDMRLAKSGIGVDFSIDAEGISEKPAAYTSVAIGDPGSGVPIQVINVGGPVDLYILNTPLLRDSDDTQGIASVYYATAKGRSPGDWLGAYLFEGDVTGEYTDLDVFTNEPLWGTAIEALPAHFDYGLDTTTVLTVRVYSLTPTFETDTLESCTYDDILAGKNVAMVGNEIIQFMTAEVQPDGRTYKLSNILRARRGTNYAAYNHVGGERFILLETATMVKEINEPAKWAGTHLFKAAAKGQYVEDADTITVEMEPADLKPYTPECVKCSEDGANATITFERRSRITSELGDSATVPYREGQGSLAHFVYKVYANKNLDAKPWETDTPDFTGNVPIFSGVDFAPLTFSFDMTGISEFVVQIYEVGFVDGFPKIVHFKRINPGDWDMTELY